jgi:biotin synthase
MTTTQATRPGCWSELADQVLAGQALSHDQARTVLDAPDNELLAVLDTAYRVRRHYFGHLVRIHVLDNAKSGACSEDCSFCSQSAHYHAEIPIYGMRSADELVVQARAARDMGAATFCMVTATRGPSERDLETVCEAARRIKAEQPLQLCASLGLLAPGQAERLRAAGVDRYNHNLETARKHFDRVVSTHGWQDRVATIRQAKAAGLQACCGGIVGLGETLEDRVALAFELRELDVDSVPINFLDPRPDTPLADARRLTPQAALRALAMFRLVHPDRDVRAAGGREVVLGALAPLALYAATSIFTRGYLTTGGAEPSSDLQAIRDAGFEAVIESV